MGFIKDHEEVRVCERGELNRGVEVRIRTQVHSVRVVAGSEQCVSRQAA